MRTFNPLFAAASSQFVVHPRTTIVLQFEEDESDPFFLVSHGDAAWPNEPGQVAIIDSLISFTGGTQKIDPKASTSSIGSVTFEALDLGNALSTWIALKHSEGKSLRGKKAQIYYGFGQLTTGNVMEWSDYEQQFTMIIKEYQISPNKITFTADDIQRAEQKEIFRKDKAYLVETVTDVQDKLPISVLSTSGKFGTVAHDASYSHRPNETVGYVKIADEIICHQGIVNDPTYGVSLDVIERGALNTLAVEHEVEPGAESDKRPAVEEFIYLEGPALKLLYAIQTGILYDQGGATLPDRWHLHINPSYVRLDDYLTADPLLWEPQSNTGRTLRFEDLDKTNGERFITQEILAVLMGIRPVYADGQIGFRRLAGTLTDATYVYELNNDNVVNFGELKYNLNDVINDISVLWDFSWKQDKYLRTLQMVDIDGIDKYGEGQPKVMQFKGLKSSQYSDEYVINLFESYRNRFAGGGYELTAELMPRVNFLEVGDIVRVVTNQIHDPLTNASLDRNFEVQQISPNMRTGRARLNLFASTDQAGDLTEIGGEVALDDTYYTAPQTPVNWPPTDISTLPGYDNGVLTQDVTLTGGDFVDWGVYYHDGDLTIGVGVTVTITQNVQLRIKGTFTRLGSITGKGNGQPGRPGGTVFTQTGTTSVPSEGWPTDNLEEDRSFLETNELRLSFSGGYIGVSKAANYGYLIGGDGSFTPGGYVHEAEALLVSSHSAAPTLSIDNQDGLDLPQFNFLSLLGSGGNGAKPLIHYTSGGEHDIVQPGASGGNGGAGLMIICRGESVGVSSVIDLSGEDGEIPALYEVLGPPVYNGGGGGGCPGAYYLLIDGPGSFSSGIDNVVQNHGATGLADGQMVSLRSGSDTRFHSSENTLTGGATGLIFGKSFNEPGAMGSAGFKVQYIPAPTNPA